MNRNINDYRVDKPVTLSDLECAASHVSSMMEEMKDYPQLIECLQNIRRLLATAAEAYAGGDREKCNSVFAEVRSERAMLFCSTKEM